MGQEGGSPFSTALFRDAFSDLHLALPDFILKVYLSGPGREAQLVECFTIQQKVLGSVPVQGHVCRLWVQSPVSIWEAIDQCFSMSLPFSPFLFL